jgi:hypothetical protein
MWQIAWSSFALGITVGVVVSIAVFAAVASRVWHRPTRRTALRAASVKRSPAGRAQNRPPESFEDVPELGVGGDADGGWWVRVRGTVAVIASLVAVLLIALAWVKFRGVDLPLQPQQPPPVAAPAVPPVIVNIHIQLQQGIEGPHFNARPHVRQGVVEGKHGRYYLIRLKDAAAQEMMFFEPGQFEKDDLGRELNVAIDAFRKDVADSLRAGGVHFEMFVRGSADHLDDDKEYIGLLLPGQSKTISYHPALDEAHNVFSSDLKTHIVTRAYSNRDLPNLRGSYICDRLGNSGLKATVLEGLVTEHEDELDRNVTMLLFVTWPAQLE